MFNDCVKQEGIATSRFNYFIDVVRMLQTLSRSLATVGSGGDPALRSDQQEARMTLAFLLRRRLVKCFARGRRVYNLVYTLVQSEPEVVINLDTYCFFEGTNYAIHCDPWTLPYERSLPPL